MSNPHHFGADDPYRPRHLASIPHTPASPLQSDFSPSSMYAPASHSNQHYFERCPGHAVGPGGGGNAAQPSPQLHGYSPVVQTMEPRRPHLTITVQNEQVQQPFSFEYQSATTPQDHQLPHPFYGNSFVDGAGPSHLNQSGQDGNFGPFQDTPVEGNNVYLNLPPQEWPTQQANPSSSSSRSTTGRSGGSSTSGKASTLGKRTGAAAASQAKVPRHQFTACGACRHRRVKCDLRARQEESEHEAQVEESRGSGAGTVRRRKVSCTNCQERGTNCVDEYAPLKAAKQLRRGKRISEIEMLYGKSATDAALASQGEDADRPQSPAGLKLERIPELTREFFDSAFFRRFHIQRPLMDPLEFVTRYLSKPIPCSAAMGREGAVLCHCLYAWAVSYGVDERGRLDVPEGQALGSVNLLAVGENETKHQADRQRRLERLYPIVRTILREVDDCGILRRPSWDGVRVLLLILPLTEGLLSPVERQAIYQSALSQVYMLCSTEGSGYDGLPAALPESPIRDDHERRDVVRMRIYWYAFVHESLMSGLRGNPLLLSDDEDMSMIQEAVERQPLVNTPGHYHTTVKMAVTPIHLAHASRLVHASLTSKEARRRESVNVDLIHNAWDILDKTWDQFDSIKTEAPAEPYRHREEAVYFADSWKVGLFEVHMTILKALEDRLERLESAATGSSARPSASRSRSGSPVTTRDIPGEISRLNQLFAIAKSKAELRTRQIVEIVRTHLGTSFFEWDASHVRDGTYWAAIAVARGGGSDEDVTSCLQALNEGRWAFTKSMERSTELRQSWLNFHHRGQISPQRTPQAGDALSTSHSVPESPFTPPTFESRAEAQLDLQPGASWPSTTPMPSSARFSPVQPEPLSQQGSPFTVFQPTSIQTPGVPDFTGGHGHSSALPPHHSPNIPNQPGGVGYPPGEFVLQPDGSHVLIPPYT